jgi:hypothetical protein
MKLSAIVLLFLLFACTLTPKQHVAPQDLIPQDSMVIILHDMSIMESFIHQKYVQLERYALLMRMSGDSLLGNFGVTRARFETSMEYYGKQPKLFMQIYDSIIFKLEGGKVNPSPHEALEQFR